MSQFDGFATTAARQPAVGFSMGGADKFTFVRPPVQPTPWDKVPILAETNGEVVRLTIDYGATIPSEERYRQAEIALQTARRRAIPVLVGPGKYFIEAPCVIVASGFSARGLLPKIREHHLAGHDIIAVKGAHDWLIKNGIVPKAAVAIDPQRSRARCFRRRHPEVLYMLASQMHPDTWDWMRGYRVLIYNNRLGVSQERRPGWEREYLVEHASTTGISALILLAVMGRRNFELYGFDSSLPELSQYQRLWAKLRGWPIKVDGTRAPKRHNIFRAVVGQQMFWTTGELVQQVIDFQELLPQFNGEVKINAHGHGYLQAVLSAGKAMGWPV